ncbi:MAG: paraquat-inducible protein A [Burkholderiales bacterium]
MTTALSRGLVACSECALVVRPVSPEAPGYCPRCSEPLAFRRDHAIQRTWAFLVAAAILYVPANLLPVLDTTTLTGSEPDTIMSGVILLWATGSWPLALIVFVASIVIPIGKIVALGYVLFTVQRKRSSAQLTDRQRTKLYRAVEFIGRWSMLDVFVDTFVVALVQLAPLMSVAPGPGVVYFMAVVVLTMFAAMSFDSRLIWDRATAPTLATRARSSLAAPRGGTPGSSGRPFGTGNGR